MNDSSWFAWRDSNLVLKVALQPNASADEFVGIHGEALKIRVQAPPVDGRANDRLIEFLAAAFRCPRANVKLIRGTSSRRKTVEIGGGAQIPEALQLLGLHPPSGGALK